MGWEDAQNKLGGKWVFQLSAKEKKLDRHKVLDDFWLHTMLGMIGEDFEHSDEITGAVISIRKGVDRIAVWTRTAPNREKQVAIGQHFKKLLGVTTTINYQSHGDAANNKSSWNNAAKYEA